MILEVELADPAGQLLILAALGVKSVKVVAGGLPADLGDAGQALGEAPGVLRHRAGGAAAAVAVSAGEEDVVCELLLLVALPGADDRGGVQVAVVGGVVAVAGLVGILGGDEVGEDLRPVDALPPEGVHRQLVELVPGDLGGHEVVDAALAQDLRQGRGIAEDVGQPEDLVVLAELVAEELFAVEELPHHALARDEVAVGLQPHAALDLPAALSDALLDLFKEIGIALLDEGVELRLAGHEFIFGVLVHQL